MKILIALTLLLTCGGCTARYQDVSQEAEYRHLVGKRYETIVDLQILGVTHGDDYPGTIDVYKVTGEPSFGGREVLTRDPLPKGTRLLVVSVRSCSNCMFTDAVEIEVSLDAGYDTKPVYLWTFGEMAVPDPDDGTLILNPARFQFETEKKLNATSMN